MQPVDPLSSIFPLTTGYHTTAPACGVTVGGKPLAEVLQSMMNVIRAQSATIANFHNMLAQQHQEWSTRFETINVRLEYLEYDLQLGERPIPAFGQPACATLHTSFSVVERRLARLERKRKIEIGKTVAVLGEKLFVANMYRKWFLWYRVKGIIATLRGASDLELLRSYLHKWTRFIVGHKESTSQARKLRGLLYCTQKKMVQSHFAKWLRYHEEYQKELVVERSQGMQQSEAMASTVSRGITRRYFGTWMHFVFSARSRWKLVTSVLELEKVNSLRHKRTAFFRWVQCSSNCRAQRIMHEKISVLEVRNHQALVRRRLSNWKRFTLNIRKSAALRHRNLCRLATLYFRKLSTFRERSQQVRFQETTGQAIIELTQRCDKLSVQMDVSLRTLAHTNAVLTQIVGPTVFGGEVDGQVDDDDDGAARQGRRGMYENSIMTDRDGPHQHQLADATGQLNSQSRAANNGAKEKTASDVLRVLKSRIPA